MSEANLLLLCRRDELQPGDKMRVASPEGDLCVYNVSGQFFASSDRCTHGLSSLSEGEIIGDEIECAMHFGTFHIPSGKPMQAPCSIPLKTYEVRLVGEEVFAVLV